MDNSIDTVFYWESAADPEPNECRIRIYWITWEKAIVIATDITNNSGRKVADVTKKIIHFLGHLYDLVACKIMLIEHYTTDDSPKLDTYFQVLVFDNQTIRFEIEKSKLIELVKEPI